MVNGSQRRGMAYIMRRTTSRAASGLGAGRLQTPSHPRTRRDHHKGNPGKGTPVESSDAEIGPVTTSGGGRKPEPEVDYLSNIISDPRSRISLREIADRAGGNKRGLRIRSSADIEKDFELPSYARVENMFPGID